ncbi:hypothetical protein C8Q70DRAFT_1033978 [Cubamyces menziesii]|nr:hypothetical protein C8Q70DRAFT_1033978 [Cubamyces menziesii]
MPSDALCTKTVSVLRYSTGNQSACALPRGFPGWTQCRQTLLNPAMNLNTRALLQPCRSMLQLVCVAH